MTSYFSVEHSKSDSPLLLLYGLPHPLAVIFLRQLDPTLQIVVIKKHKHEIFNHENTNNLYVVEKEDAHRLSHIKEKFSYGFMLLEEPKDTEHLSELFTKLDKDKAKTLFLIPATKLLQFEDLFITLRKYKSFSFGILGELFGKNVPVDFSAASKIVQNAIQNKYVELSSNGLTSVYPISEEDCLSLVNLLIFGYHKRERFFLLFYEQPQTLTACVHLLRRVEPDLELRLNDRKSFSEIPSFEVISSTIQSKFSELPIFLSEYVLGFEESVVRLTNNNFKHKPSNNYQEEVSSSFSFSALFAYLGITAFVILIIHLVLFGTFFYFVLASFSSLKKGDFTNFSSSLERASYPYYLIETQLKLIAPYTNIEGFKDIPFVFEETLPAVMRISKLMQKISLDKGALPKQDYLTLTSSLLELHFLYEKTRTESSYVRDLKYKDFSPYISVLQNGSYLLGYKTPRNYLILFQNNAELRPGGGFIGSVAELTIDAGSVTNFQIFDVYDLDGQLKAHVEPHYIIRRFLEPHLYLRDSNFELDFEESASTSALLYKLSTGKTLDGIIGVDYEVLRRIVQSIEPIEINGKTLDGNGLFDYIQNSIDSSFFPGSSIKKNILTNLYDKLFLRLANDRALLYKTLSLIPDLTDEKHILFAFNDKNIQTGFTANGFSGSYQDSRTQDKNSYINDFLAINEANIGVNKANSSVSRTIDYEARLTNRGIFSKATLQLFNSYTKKLPYKAYIRLAAPVGSKLTSILVDGKEQDLVEAVIDPDEYERKNFEAPLGLEVDKTNESDKTVFGFVVEVGPDSSKKIEISYENGLLLARSKISKYSLFILKQPGTVEYPMRVSLEAPVGYEVISDKGRVLPNEKDTYFEKIINGDIIFELQLIRP